MRATLIVCGSGSVFEIPIDIFCVQDSLQPIRHRVKFDLPDEMLAEMVGMGLVVHSQKAAGVLFSESSPACKDSHGTEWHV